MNSPTPPPPRTFLGTVTQAMQTVAKIDFSKLPLKVGARVPKLVVEGAGQPQAYPLLGEYYTLGRGSKSCDIVVSSPLVSQVHLSLTRDRNRPGNPFVLKDHNSTNGIYRGKKRISQLPLRHGDVLTLGPPALTEAVTIRYVDPAPWYVQTARYGLYGFTGVTTLLVLWIVAIEWPKIPVRPMPDSVQGPISVYGNENQQQVLLNPISNQAHIEKKRLKEYSKFLPKAVIASEDSRYYWHLGVDPIGIARALNRNIRSGGILEGASTITQQLARSIYPDYVGTDDSAARKIREIIVALKLETFYSKDQLMLLYLNRVYLGNNFYGFEDAAQFYFDKSATDLNLSEAATLVGILPAPNAFNPVKNYQAAVSYRNRVLERMVSQGMVSIEEGRRARRSRIELSPTAREQLQSVRAPYFYSYIFTELEALLGTAVAREGNYYIETSLNLTTQKQAETALQAGVTTIGSRYGFSQGALVTLNTANGEIQALVGGVDYASSQFNRASQALRQPGSTFKVFAYASALSQGISPRTAFACSPLTWQGQSFRSCRSGSGALDMYAGMARSENPIALRIGKEVGLDNIVQLAHEMGIRSELKAVPGLVLGQSEVTPLEITGAFAAIANNGIWNKPHGIQRILDSSDCTDPKNRQTCRVIFEFSTSEYANIPVLDPEVSRTMVTLMQGVMAGTGRSGALGMGEAGKTGTTSNNVDLWFIGFVPRVQLVSGVWLGNDNNSPTNGSSAQAAQIWGDYMRKLIQ